MTSLLKLGPVMFPAPTGAAINMMPFVMGDPNSIPSELHGYLPLIEACHLEPEQFGEVGYLSIQETTVKNRQSQRRPGIHTEKHPSHGWGGGWGKGYLDARRHDGIYAASTVPDSCRAWDLHIDTPGPMGDCEHFRERLEGLNPVVLERDTLYWMTDSAPHESLPLEPGTFRQWFRLVTHKIGLWYEQHSTASPLGVIPGCPIITGNKFALETE